MPTQGIVYYCCNTHPIEIDEACRKQLNIARGTLQSVTVSLNREIDFGNKRITVHGTRSPEMMHAQILLGLQESSADVVYLCESDVLYHPSHFKFLPSEGMFVYNTNVWKVRYPDGLAMWTDDMQQVSGICAYRDVLLDFYRQRVRQIDQHGFNRHYEPGIKQSVGCQIVTNRVSEYPNICIRHEANLTKSKWNPTEFRNPKYAKGWKESDRVEGWGITLNHFPSLLSSIRYAMMT